MDSLFIVMPAYNEEAVIAQVVKAWYPLLSKASADSKLVIADSGSSDQTHAILEDLQKECPNLVILSDTGKKHGPKVMALYKYAIEQKADYVFQTDSDNQTLPSEFDAFWEARKEYDGIFGVRNKRGDGKLRHLYELTLCFILRCIYGVKIPDSNAPFRLMKCESVAKYIDHLPDDFAFPNVMMTVFFNYFKEDTSFQNISFLERQASGGTGGVWPIIKMGFHFIGDAIHIRRTLA